MFENGGTIVERERERERERGKLFQGLIFLVSLSGQWFFEKCFAIIKTDQGVCVVRKYHLIVQKWYCGYISTCLKLWGNMIMLLPCLPNFVLSGSALS